MKLRKLAVTMAATVSMGAAQATLFDRGGGLLYDDVLNVTWLQDANYAKTSGYQNQQNGAMNWSSANNWATDLSFYDSVRNVVYTDWRLASNTPVGADWNYNRTTDGTTDNSFNTTSKNSEMSYMYYVNLGLKGFYSSTGVHQPNFGANGNGTLGGSANVGLVKNLQSDVAYWSGTVYEPDSDFYAWKTSFGYGYQVYDHKNYSHYAWAVRDGDVTTPIPEPETYALMLAGLGLLGLMARRRKQKLNA